MRRSLTWKFITSISVCMLITTVVLLYGILRYVNSQICEITAVRTKLSTKAVLDVLSVTDTLMTEQVRRSMALLIAEASATGEPSLGQLTQVGERTVPDLLLGDEPQANNFRIVDDVVKTMGGTATLFVKNGDEFVRISTNVKKADGSRATGTILDPSGKTIRKIRLGQPYYGQVDILGTPYITGYEPIRDNANSVIGIYYVGYLVTTLAGLQDTVTGTRVLDNGFLAVVDDHGRVRFHSRSAKLETVERILETKDEGWTIVEREFDKWGFKIVAAYPETDVRSQELRAGMIAVGAAFAVLLFLSLFVHGSLRSTILKPIGQMERIVNEVAEGHLDVEIDAGRADEVGRLLTGMKGMVEKLSGLVIQVRKSGIQVTSSATQIASSAKELEATAAEQAASANEVNVTGKQISATANDLAQTMGNVVAMAAEAGELAGAGMTGLADIRTTMQSLLDATVDATEKLEVINEKASNISNVTTTITKVANQTNLLSLNAAIEAEKAGEYGVGFSVVAREIRRLADQTAVAALDIEEMIEEMQNAVKDGVAAAEEYSNQARISSDKITGIGEDISRVIEKTRQLGPQFESVNEGMQQQSRSASQISTVMEQLSEASAQTRDSLAEFNRVTEQLNEAVQGLQSEVARFSVGS